MLRPATLIARTPLGLTILSPADHPLAQILPQLDHTRGIGALAIRDRVGESRASVKTSMPAVRLQVA
jgi:hypothetical protein